MRQPPGAAADREALKWELVELEAIIRTRAPSFFCRARWVTPCPCWKCTALRLIRYSPGYGQYRWPR